MTKKQERLDGNFNKAVYIPFYNQILQKADRFRCVDVAFDRNTVQLVIAYRGWKLSIASFLGTTAT